MLNSIIRFKIFLLDIKLSKIFKKKEVVVNTSKQNIRQCNAKESDVFLCL